MLPLSIKLGGKGLINPLTLMGRTICTDWTVTLTDLKDVPTTRLPAGVGAACWDLSDASLVTFSLVGGRGGNSLQPP